MRNLIADALSYFKANLDDANEALLKAYSEADVAAALALAQAETADPIVANFDPDVDELMVRTAVHVLSDAGGDCIIVRQDAAKDLWLVASIQADQDDDENLVEGKLIVTPRPRGTVEYQVSDGPPGARAHSEGYYHLKHAVARYDALVAAGGWPEETVAGDCRRCGCEVSAGYCCDETCPFSDHTQPCPAGWEGHPAEATGPCTCGGKSD